ETFGEAVTRLLISVRTADEALRAADAGADLLDLKEPRAGALGALPPGVICDIVTAVRARHPDVPVSATIGDLQREPPARIAAAARRIADCEVDYVKVGVRRGPRAAETLRALDSLRLSIVPVLLCDDGLDDGLVHDACNLSFPAVMADTMDKRAGSLLEYVSARVLGAFIATVRASGRLSGLAGNLGLRHISFLRDLAPDLAGFRG